MKSIKLIGSIVLATAASSAFAVGPAPEYRDPATGQYVVRANIAHEVPALVWAFGSQAPAPSAQMTGFTPSPWSVERSAQYRQPQTEVAGYTAQPWAVEHSAFYRVPFAVAKGGDDDRGRL